MKERLVRGTNMISVVRALRSRRHHHPLPELGPGEQELLRKRISRSTWYSIQVFDSLLQTVHRYVFDGSEAAAQQMGRESAREVLIEDATRSSVIVPNDPLASLVNMSRRWRDVFNFGEITVTDAADSMDSMDATDSVELPEHHKAARVRLSGFPDMSACLGHNIMGWALEVVEAAGGNAPHVRLEERPWMHNNVLQFVVDWS